MVSLVLSQVLSQVLNVPVSRSWHVGYHVPRHIAGDKLRDGVADEQVRLLNIIPEEFPNFSLRGASLSYEIATNLDVGAVCDMLTFNAYNQWTYSWCRFTTEEERTAARLVSMSKSLITIGLKILGVTSRRVFCVSLATTRYVPKNWSGGSKILDQRNESWHLRIINLD